MSPEEPVIELESEFLAKGKPKANGRSIAVRPVHVRNVVLFGPRIRRCLTEAAGIGGYLTVSKTVAPGDNPPWQFVRGR